MFPQPHSKSRVIKRHVYALLTNSAAAVQCLHWVFHEKDVFETEKPQLLRTLRNLRDADTRIWSKCCPTSILSCPCSCNASARRLYSQLPVQFHHFLLPEKPSFRRFLLQPTAQQLSNNNLCIEWKSLWCYCFVLLPVLVSASLNWKR